MGLSSADDDGVEEVPGGEAQCCLMPLWKVGGGHSSKDNDVNDGDNYCNHDDRARTSSTTTLFFDATTNLVVGFIPGREREVVILTKMTKTTVGWLVTWVHVVSQPVRRICFWIRFGCWRGWSFFVG